MTGVDALYPWLKAAHVAAALVFVGGVLGVALFLASVKADGSTAAQAGVIRRWDGRLVVPAMLLVWAFGLALAITGGWLTQGWLQAKLLVVVALSGVHGVQSGRLRKLARGEPMKAGVSPYLVVAGAATIAVLAVVKPG